MAVPFSRPQYHGGSGVFLPPMPMRQRRRPRQHQQQQGQQSSASPIEQLLSGDRHDLSGLSFTSRLAFYALYEAWRLLQDLTGSRGENEAIHRPPTPTEATAATSKSPFNANTSPAESASATYMPPPISCSTRPQEHVVSDCSGERATVEGKDHCSSLPDIVPAEHSREADSECKEQMIANQYEDDDDDEEDGEEEEEEDEDEVDEVDGKMGVETCLLKQCFAVPPLNSPWSAVGFQLCQIASAFEVGLCSPSDERQRRIFLAYRDIKLRTFQRDLKLAKDSGGESHFAKSLCRQILLSGIWLLVKKVL